MDRLLFASKLAQPDIQVAVEFICTRVKKPTEEDYRKLGQLIRYIGVTIHVPLILGGNYLKAPIWNVDSSYTVNNDMRSHTGVLLYLGHGTLMYMS